MISADFKRRRASQLHDLALSLCLIPGCERHANIVSKEAEIADAEVQQSRLPTPAGWSDTDWIKHLQESTGVNGQTL
jgi:hypothetical protein